MRNWHSKIGGEVDGLLLFSHFLVVFKPERLHAAPVPDWARKEFLTNLVIDFSIQDNLGNERQRRSKPANVVGENRRKKKKTENCLCAETCRSMARQGILCMYKL
jgi:hypothetical protein